MKTIKFLSGGAVLVALMMAFSSCEGFDLESFLNGGKTDDEENVDGGIGGIGEDSGSPTTQLTPDAQKAKLEAVGIKLIDKCPADDFQKFFDLYGAFCEEYAGNDDYDFSAFEDLVEESMDKVFDEKYSNTCDEVGKICRNTGVTVITVAFANHTGVYTFGADAVVKDGDSADGLRLNLPLNGKNYVAELKTSGKVTKATYTYIEKEVANNDHNHRDENGCVSDNVMMPDAEGNWVDPDQGWTTYFDDQTRIEMDVPECIDITIYENGAKMAEVKMTLSQSFSANGLNPAVDNFNADVEVFLDNGYEIEFSKVAFDGAKQQFGGSVIFKKDGTELVAAAGAGKAELVNSVYEYDYEWGSGEYKTVELRSAKDFNVVVDILGEVQLKGKCSDAKAAYEAYEAYFDALSRYDNNGNRREPDESTARRHLNNLNACFDMGVYYDLGNNRQAKVIFDMDKHWDEWDDMAYYDIKPLIVFENGMSYSIEEYFTEEAFELLIQRFGEASEDYSDLLGDYGFAEKEQPSSGYVPTDRL